MDTKPLATFYCGFQYGRHEDLGYIKLYGPHGFEFVLLQLGDERDRDINNRCNRLAAALSDLWDGKANASFNKYVNDFSERISEKADALFGSAPPNDQD